METKPWYLSRTEIGILVAFAAIVVRWFGGELNAGDQTVILDRSMDLITAAVGMVGLIVGFIGRIKAKKGISLK